jgi:hypothetical protein
LWQRAEGRGQRVKGMEQRVQRAEKLASVLHLTDLTAFEGREESKSIREIR